MTTALRLTNAHVRNTRRERSARNRRAMTLNAKTAGSVNSTKLEGHFAPVRIYGSASYAKRTRRSINAGLKHLKGFWSLKMGAIISQFVTMKQEWRIISRSRRSKTASGLFLCDYFRTHVFSLGMDKNKTHNWALMIRMTVDEALTNSYSVLGPARISQLFKDTETEYAPKIYEIILEPTTVIYDDVMIYVSGFSNEDLLNGKNDGLIDS